MTLQEYLDTHPVDPNFVFTPFVWHNVDGDMVEMYWSNEPAYAEPVYGKGGKWIGDRFIGQESKQVVGVNIFGIRRMTGDSNGSHGINDRDTGLGIVD